MSKIKTTYIVSTLKRSGPTNQLFNIINNLDRAIFEPHLITLSPEPEDSRWADFENIGVKLYSLNLSRVKGLFFAKPNLSKLINKIQPQIIHSQGIRADSLLAELKTNASKVTTIHNFPQQDYKMTYGKFLGFLMLISHVKKLKKIDKVIGCSLAVASNLEEKFKLSGVKGIPNGVDQKYFLPVLGNINYIKSKLNLPLDSKLWISTGHLSKRKDPIFIIKSWLNLPSQYKNQHLIFLGAGELTEECKVIAKESTNIHFLGRVNNVLDYLQGSDYFVSASKAEGLPMAAIEAMACGLPVLLSDIEPHKEIHAMSPNIGELYELGDEASFLRSFEKLKNSDYEFHSKAALALISTELSAIKMSEKYQSVYTELLGK